MREELKQNIFNLMNDTKNLPGIFHLIWNERNIFAKNEEIIDTDFYRPRWIRDSKWND